MTKKQLIAVLSEIGLRPSRKLGQNFMIDGNLLDAIVRTAAPVPDEHVLEIGPGTGALTGRLLQAGCQVTAVEIDARLVAYLGTTFADHPRLHLIEADACRLDYDSIMPPGVYRCVANLPYACSSPWLAGMAGLDNPPTRMHLLLQREMAERLAASPGSKAFGAFTVTVGVTYEVQRLRAVPPEVFYPPPEVESALMQLTRRQQLPASGERRAVAILAREAFGQRRKKMVNVLGSRYGPARVREAFAKLGLALDLRPEQLPVNNYVRLADCLGVAPDRPDL